MEIKNVYYFEIANFPGKLQWSNYGVNAYGRYADKVNEIKDNKNENVVSPIELKKIINTWHPPHANRRLIDQALEQLINNVFAGLFKSLAPKTTITNAIKTVYATIRSRRLITKLRDNNLPNKYDLFIGQVSEDSQTVFQSQETQVSAIKKAHLLAKNSKKQLVVRLHPAEKNISVLKEVQKFCVLNKIVISNPLIRKKYYEKNSKENIDKVFTLMIVGGSQGAKIFDEIIHESILKISQTNSLKIIHQTNKKDIDFLRNFYSENKIENMVFNFDQNLDLLLNQSDLCITRAGASSLAEIAILNIPFIAIPLPSSKDNHQFENAKYYKDKDCCWIIDQMSFDKEKFEFLLLNLLKNKDDFFKKKKNLENLNYQNTWNNVNENLLKIINEN